MGPRGGVVGLGVWGSLRAPPAGDMYSHDGEAEEPEWVKTEREQFVEFRDKNRDGKMDPRETRDWILPADYDHAEAEARHLVYESDRDKVCGDAVLGGVCQPIIQQIGGGGCHPITTWTGGAAIP